MSRALKYFGLPFIAAALVAALSLTPAFAQGGGYYGGGDSNGGGSMAGPGSLPYGPAMGSGYSAAPSYQPPSQAAPSVGHGRAIPRHGVVTLYVVRAGDTLAGIARRFGVSIQALVHANRAITNINRIFVGQTLIIPSRGVAFFGDGDNDADDVVRGQSPAGAAGGYQPPAGMMPAMPYGGQQAPAAPAQAAPQTMTQPPAPPAPAPPAVSSQTVTINLVAHNLMFNMSSMTVPAGARVAVDFDNQDSGVPHNFAVYTDSSAQQLIFRGQIVTGPATTTYMFTAPSQPGTYFFRCDVHSTVMTGQFVVR